MNLTGSVDTAITCSQKRKRKEKERKEKGPVGPRALYFTTLKLSLVIGSLFQLGWEVERGRRKRQTQNNHLIIYKCLRLSGYPCGEDFSAF